MYSQNTFFFNDLDTICWFASTILPRRLDMIRSVYIEWDTICFWHPRIKPPPPYDRETWFEVWRILSSMKGLRELRVTIWNGPRMDSETEIEVFGPMRGVKGADVFELELPWEYMGEDETPHSDAPFRITRVKRKYDPEPWKGNEEVAAYQHVLLSGIPTLPATDATNVLIYTCECVFRIGLGEGGLWLVQAKFSPFHMFDI